MSKINQPSSEEWRPVVGFEGYYEISSRGNLRSCDRKVHHCRGGYSIKKSLPIKTQLLNNGYIGAVLNKEGKQKWLLIHRIVAEAFIPNPDNMKFVGHTNTIRTDNRVENLSWCTQLENNNNPITREKISRSCKGRVISKESLEKRAIAFQAYYTSGKYQEYRERMRHIKRCIPVFCYKKNGEPIGVFSSIAEASRITGITSQRISDSINNKQLTAGGFVWKKQNQNTE